MKPVIRIILISLVVAMLACTLQANPQPSSSKMPPKGTGARSTAHLPPATPAAEWTVCTGLFTGSLHVRECAGTDCEASSTLPEGQSVSATGEATKLGAATWVQVSAPASGWVNARYLCREEGNP